MKTIRHPLFLYVLASYVIYYLLKQMRLPMPELITSYYADLVSLFIINTAVLFVLRKAYCKPNYELPIVMVGFSLLAITLIFEWIQPKWSSHMVADPLDIVFYAVSAFSYVVWRKNWRLL